MASSDHAHDDMWRTPVPAPVKTEEEPVEGTAPTRTAEEHAVEDTWYQVLRRKHVESSEDE